MHKIILALCSAFAFINPLVNVSAFAEQPPQSIQSILAEAREAQSRKDFNSAAESYRKATELDPSIPELWANLGVMYHESGKFPEAIQSFKTALRLKPSLFVPQLFLGIEYLESKNVRVAIPYLENAAKLNPKDSQTELSLGKAYAMLNEGDKAAEFYWKAILLAPANGDTWLSLGTSYLKQVESDARLMNSTYGHSAYVNLRAGEVLAEEGKLVQAENSYKIAVASSFPLPCARSQLGIALLRDQKIQEAREQFKLETHSASYCGLAPMGLAVADLIGGHPDAGLKGLTAIASTDPRFVRSNLPLFRGAISKEQARSSIELAQAQQVNGASLIDVGSLIENTLLADEAPPEMSLVEESQPEGIGLPTPESAEKFYAAGQYLSCNRALKPAIDTIRNSQLQMLAFCSFYIGDFQTASTAAKRLKTAPATQVQGLYWESKADEKLAIAALIRAGEIDANSPRMHVLLGDVFRQERRWEDAESEYRKAAALDPKSHSARLSLAIALFTELKTDEAFNIAGSLLAEDPSDAEANLLAGEILVQRNLFSEAEPYLTKCTNLSQDLISRVAVLLGQVYAETGRIPLAISQYKLSLSTDNDGSIHYRLGRLYLKTSQRTLAEEAFREAKRIQSQRDGVRELDAKKILY